MFSYITGAQKDCWMSKFREEVLLQIKSEESSVYRQNLNSWKHKQSAGESGTQGPPIFGNRIEEQESAGD